MNNSLGIAALLAAACFSSASLAQTMFRGDAGHSGHYAGPAPREFHRVKWTFPTGDGVVSSPVFADGVVYFGGDDGNIYAVDAVSGHQLWKKATLGPVPSTPCVYDGLVYATSYDGKFYALNARTGATRWKFVTAGERRFEAKGVHGLLPRTQTIADPFDVFLSSPVVAQGTVYFGSGDGNVYALDAKSGALRWKFQTGDVVHASPAYADGAIFVGSWDGRLYAIDAATGKQRWQVQGGLDPDYHNQVGFQSSPAVVDGVVYSGSRDSNVYAIDAATGRQKWKFSTGTSWVNSTPAVVDGKVYFATSDSSLYFVVDAQSGKALQQHQGKAFTFSSLSMAGDVVFLGIGNGTLEAHDVASGNVLWEFQTDASKRNRGWVLTSERTFNNPMLYHSNWREAPMVANDLQLSVGAIHSSPLVVNGVVYFGSTDGNVYAIE